MKNVVTPETARKLKDAGFKQPEFAVGQFWWSRDSLFVVVGKMNSNPNTWTLFRTVIGGLYEASVLDLAFAPTATDFIGVDTFLTRTLDDKFVIYDHWNLLGGWIDEFIHKNPAEAAALAWFKAFGK
jgi:hypothetical protein